MRLILKCAPQHGLTTSQDWHALKWHRNLTNTGQRPRWFQALPGLAPRQLGWYESYHGLGQNYFCCRTKLANWLFCTWDKTVLPASKTPLPGFVTNCGYDTISSCFLEPDRYVHFSLGFRVGFRAPRCPRCLNLVLQNPLLPYSPLQKSPSLVIRPCLSS